MNLIEDEKISEIFKSKRTTYYITSTGRVLNSKGKELKVYWSKKRNYYWVRTKDWNKTVHRLVAIAFVENPLNKPQINHIDGNKRNNNSNNLEWVTPKENIRHSIKLGLVKKPEKNSGPNLKYTDFQIKEVFNRVKSGMTYLKAGEIYNMPYSTVAHLIRGSRRKICD